MIVHLFNGDFYFHTKPFVNNIITHSNHKHYFIITITEKTLFDSYVKYLNSLDASYSLCYNEKPRLIYKLILYLWNYRGIQLSSEARIFSKLWNFRKHPIVLHWYSKSYLLLPCFKRVVWVCWGNIRRLKEGASITDELLYKFIKSKIYKNYYKIVCLLDSDKKELVENYACQERNIQLIPYIPQLYGEAIDFTHESTYNNSITKVLLGNSANNLKEYLGALEKLKDYSNFIKLYTLMNYGTCSNTDREAFYAKAKDIFKENFYPIEEFIPSDSYLEWLKQFDIYISNTSTQSGLGTIYRMLFFGKKLFLTGYNLSWCKHNGFIVFNINDLETNDVALLAPLSIKEREHNQKKILSLLDRDKLADRWESFYSQISY